jgi:hypothetical protein
MAWEHSYQIWVRMTCALTIELIIVGDGCLLRLELEAWEMRENLDRLESGQGSGDLKIYFWGLKSEVISVPGFEKVFSGF